MSQCPCIAAASKPAKAPKVPRAPTEYNKFFSEQMKREEIKALPHKERMAAVGQIWKHQKESVKAEDTLPLAPPVLVRTDSIAVAPSGTLPVVSHVQVRPL